MTPDTAFRVPRRVLLAYALPAFVVALPTIPVYIHLPALYGVHLGLGLATTGLILLAARIFDTVTDPLIGVLSDRFAFRGAHRKPWIALGAVIAGIGVFKILNPPDGVDTAYLLVWSIVLYAGWTLVAVPYLTWGAELSGRYHERSRITAWREAVTLLGILGAGALGAIGVEFGWSERETSGAIAWAAIGLGVIVIPVLLGFVPDRGPAATPSRPSTAGMVSLLKNRPFLRLLSAWFLNGLANGIPAALFFIYLEFGLGAGASERPGFILVYFLAAVLAIPLWLRFSRHTGKHRAWCWAMLVACAAFSTVPLIPTGAFVPFYVVCIVTGMALGADLALPPSIQADVADYDRWKFGRQRTGLQFALWGMSTKLALAGAVGLALPGVAAFGFDPAEPTEDGILALTVIYAWVPVVIKMVAVAAVWRFPLTPARHAIVQKRLARRADGFQTPKEAF